MAEWKTIGYAARKLGVTKRTVRDWIHDGRLSAFKLSPTKQGRWRIDEDVLLDFQRKVQDEAK